MSRNYAKVEELSSSFTKHFEEARSRTGSPCVHKGNWGCFPNKLRRGYHGALLATSTEAHFRSILLYRSINTFCPEEQSFTFCSLKTKRISVVLFSFLSDDFIQCFFCLTSCLHIFFSQPYHQKWYGNSIYNSPLICSSILIYLEPQPVFMITLN